jgi:hypothetical protein
MTEQSIEKKEEQKKNILTLSIDLDEIAKESDFKVPENQDIWHKPEDMTPEYNEMMNVVSILALYLAKLCNEGPEVKDNISKRLVTVKTMLTMFISNLNISGYMVYGVLTELLLDNYMKISGKHQTISLLKHIQKLSERKAKEKSNKYVS